MGKQQRWQLIAVALVSALALAACSADDDAVGDADMSTADRASQSSDRGQHAEPDVAEDGAAGMDDAGPVTDADDAADPAAVPASARDIEGVHVIRQGRFTVVYERSFDEAFSAVSAIAEGLGGSVTGVTSETTDDGANVGEVTVKVPVDAYDRLLVDVADLGEVASRHVTEEDVSGEVVDLRSRLRHLERQESFYLGLFDEADGVSDAITIQGHLERVQERREEVQGRLDHLEQRTSMSTLAVRLVPEGHEEEGFGPEPEGFAGYWDDAVSAFVRVAGTLLVFVVGSAPLLMASALAIAASAALVRAWRGKGVARPAPSANMTGE